MSENTAVENEDGDYTLDGVTKEEARDRLARFFERGFSKGAPVLIEALPAVGKSYGLIKWAAETGNPLTVFTERHELYDQYEEWATDDFSLTAQQLPVFHQDCPTAEEPDDTLAEGPGYRIQPGEEDTDSEAWRDRVLQKYKQGVSGRELHNRATEYFGDELPCQHDGSCAYMEALERDLAEIDVLIGNFRQVFAEQYRDGRYIAFDEFPNESFIQEFSPSTVSKTVSRYVSTSSRLPFENWQDVLEYSDDPDDHPAVEEWVDDHSHDRDTKPLYRGAGGQIDARGPLLTEIALRFDQLDNRWRRADLGEGRVAVRSPEDETLALLDPPPTDGAEGVVALDGTPCIEKWELLLGEELHHHRVFDDDQKRAFLRDVLELRLIQTAETTKPYHSGISVTPDADMTLIEAIRTREGRRPSLISSLAAVNDYEERDVAAVIDKTSHYNALKGSNTFETDRLGIVIGCPQPSDNHMERWGALAGHPTTRQTDADGRKTKGLDLDFGSFGNLILEDSRENEVLQAAMRFGREEADGERGATVYIHTAAIPDWVQPEKNIPTIHAWESGGGVITVIEAIKNRDDWRTGEWKTPDLAEAIDTLSERQVLNLLKDPLLAEGYIDCRRGGRGNGRIWSNNCLEEIGTYGFVEW